jgi:hypothetical protein
MKTIILSSIILAMIPTIVPARIIGTPKQTEGKSGPTKAVIAVKSDKEGDSKSDRAPAVEINKNAPAVQPSTTVYHIPFGSASGNSIELVVANGTAQPAAKIQVKPVSLPKWLHLTPTDQSITSLKGNSEATVNFTFTIDKTAPVKIEQQLNFSVRTSTGEEWVKQIRLTVDAPTKFELYQNYPNPFNPTTTIEYDLPINGPVRISMYNILGEEVRVLVDAVQEAGHQSTILNGNDLASGVYFYHLHAGSFSETKKMVLMK